MSYMDGYIFPTSNSLGCIEILISEPGVSVSLSTAPNSFRHVVVKIYVKTVGDDFFGNSIKNWQASSAYVELSVLLEDFIQNDTAIGSSESFGQSFLKRDICSIVQTIINHLNSECQMDSIEVEPRILETMSWIDECRRPSGIMASW